MESILKEVHKQTNKIIRILNKISEKWPDVCSDIELAMYAAIKIEKTVGKSISTLPDEDDLDIGKGG